VSDLVGLVPAAGQALRLAGVAEAGTNKEVLPVGGSRPAPAHLLDAFARAGVGRAYVVLRAGKWDVPEVLSRTVAQAGPESVRLAYLVLRESSSVAETLDAAHPFVSGGRVALGFPDILFRPGDAFLRVRERQEETGADAVLGLVPTDRPEKADVVEADGGGRVRRLTIKPRSVPAPALTWIAAVWGPAITERLHEAVAAARETPGERELYPGDVLARAIDDGLRIEAVTFPQGSHLDIGTPEDLERAREWR
jgi:glucose-1-phosphate thymidylyltransferase